MSSGEGASSSPPPQPRRGSGQPALLLLGRAADQRRRYRNWLRLEATPASGGREPGAGRSSGVRREPFIQEYPGLFLLLLRLQPAPGTAQPGPGGGKATRRPQPASPGPADPGAAGTRGEPTPRNGVAGVDLGSPLLPPAFAARLVPEHRHKKNPTNPGPNFF